MKVVHIESGLGNQMLSYCEYLALKYANPKDDIYLETIIFDIPECNEVICQWNGYELERIFGIKDRNIRELFTEKEWSDIIAEIRNSEFWKKNWNYPVYITQALNNAGLKLVNKRGDFETNGHAILEEFENHKLRKKFVRTKIGSQIKRLVYHIAQKKYLKTNDNIFLKTEENVFTGQWLSLKNRNQHRELIDAEIQKVFVFPQITDERNLRMQLLLSTTNSVAIHARRGDMLSRNSWCYQHGFFRRAVKIIRKNVDNPMFVFFTDTGSIEWCRNNPKIFGLDYDKDNVYFVDWNLGESSFRDMQLMSFCKHAIITESSFGWWGAYFIKNPNKITISPYLNIDTTHHC